MHTTNDIYLDEEEPTPEWVFELQEKFREDMETIQAEFREIGKELNEIKVGIKKSNDLMDSSNELMASARAHFASSHEHMASSNARIESATLEKKMLLEESTKIQNKIHKAEVDYAETNKYWKDLIKKETQKRTKSRRVQSRQPPMKRLNNKTHDNKPTKKNKNK
ncbi:unnamed protein product [Rotaria socialis]|uniref:Uncharacterized protein n=1 Tax=Rotaria socialis TaxID=392032 RepID=A0A820SIL5_9BILA|nr:unnamed protein product [Rotaria socialis]CAF3437245.1 unnamed protein product [Rotaria socialis]CAF3640875.1 unnamed protein product [Rotaria socialis]CAF4286946.1 unnamed protein product [Rotaria socialis]CAF4458602.1 unnamed protein product [Rotaria socialis]